MVDDAAEAAMPDSKIRDKSGKLVVTNKNKAEQMLTTIGIQPAEVSRILNLAKDSIPQNGKNVKPLFSLSAYLDAVNRGDTVAMQKMVDDAAEAAMPDSKIRDKSGKLIPVYHGTQDMFYTFDSSVKGGKSRSGRSRKQTFFRRNEGKSRCLVRGMESVAFRQEQNRSADPSPCGVVGTDFLS